jgi:hypothetical protein
MRDSEEGGSKAEKIEARQSAETEVLSLDSPSNHGGRKIGDRLASKMAGGKPVDTPGDKSRSPGRRQLPQPKCLQKILKQHVRHNGNRG